MKQKRILVATDLPFWIRSTGAQQRVAVLIEQLTSAGCVVRTFCIGDQSRDDLQRAATAGFDVQFYSSDRPVKRVLPRLRWWIDAVQNKWSSSKTCGVASGSLTLNDFRWPWALDAIAECVGDFRPTSIICQYVKMAYLLEGLTKRQRQETLCVIDTHDVQHLRAKQFADQGLTHWLQIDRETELKTLSQFDLVIAIQDREADIFREMVPDVKVVTCGHATVSSSQNTNAKKENDELAIGYIGSANDANFDAIKRFLLTGWKSGDLATGNCRLTIAGSVCEKIAVDDECKTLIDCNTSQIHLLGCVQKLSAFYDQVDVVINPIQFGAGLKIKNCEALEFGKPLITTLHGAEGLTIEQREITVVVDCLTEMVEQISRWTDDRECLARQVDLIMTKCLDGDGRKKVYRQLIDALR